MDKDTPLLPFAFNSNSFLEKLPLDTTPRKSYEKSYERPSLPNDMRPALDNSTRPTLASAPKLKRKMGLSFNEKDDIKRRDYVSEFFTGDDNSSEPSSEPTSEPTMIDADSEDEAYDKDGDYGDDEVNLRKLPPSSPRLMSEFDNSYHDNEFPPNSPKEVIYNELNTSPIKILQSEFYESPTKLASSEADFGIDRFNRFRSFNDCPSLDVALETRKNRAYNRARQVIHECFENIETTINLENLCLYELPDEIKDMNNLVIFDKSKKPLYQLFLSNNKLKTLPISLFKFNKLNVLSIRQNKLTEIPPIIEKFTNLTDLNIGSNRIEFLPWQFLNLQHLQTFGSGPNPYISIHENAISITTKTLNNYKMLNYVSQISKFNDHKLPTLKALCLNKIARYDVSYQDTKSWKKFTPKVYHRLIADAIKKGKYSDTCSECDLVVVEPSAEVYEWWDILGNQNIPIRRQFCCGCCVSKYERRLSIDFQHSFEE